MILKLGMQHQGLKLYIVYINDDPWSGLTGAVGDELALWLASRTRDQGVPGSRPGRVAFRCCLEQVTFTPCLVLVKPRKPWTYD